MTKALVNLLTAYASTLFVFGIVSDGRCLVKVDHDFHVSSQSVIREVKSSGGTNFLVLDDGIELVEFNMTDGMIDYRLKREVIFFLLGTHTIERNFVYCLYSDLFVP